MKKVNGLKLIPLSFIALTLASCQGTPFTSEDFTSKIFPNGYWDFLIQILAFIVLLIAVFFIGYKPVKKAIEKRRSAINGMIEDAKNNQKVAREAASRKEETIEEGKTEASKILASARKQAEEEAALILAKAEEEAALKRKKADEDIASAKEKAKREIHDEIVDVAISASSKVLGREVSKKDNQELLNDFLKDIENE